MTFFFDHTPEAISHPDVVPPTHAKVLQSSPIAPTSYEFPSGQVHLPPLSPTPGAFSIITTLA